jgi:hypothetical protein
MLHPTLIGPALCLTTNCTTASHPHRPSHQVDDIVLGVARRDGTRDGATAVVVLRLGGMLYAAHAGDSRAVLCRDGAAHRLTEDHKPHLPQVSAVLCRFGGGLWVAVRCV